jgi:hypothetical protein
MPSGSASIQPASDRRFDVLSVADWLRNFSARLPRANPRLAASVTLLAVLMSAALALVPQRAATTAQSISETPHTVAVPAAPVKIVGATPRSDNCAEQVWPYIEQRCLRRAADRPKTSPPAHTASADEAQSGKRATVGAVAADGGAGLPSASPPAAREPASLPVAPGAVPLPSAPSVNQPSFAQEGANLRTESIREPRRRAGRHSYRSRYGRGWSRRPVLAFPF